MRTALMNTGKSRRVVERPPTNSLGESLRKRITLVPITRMPLKIFADIFVFVSRRKTTENIKVSIVAQKTRRKS